MNKQANLEQHIPDLLSFLEQQQQSASFPTTEARETSEPQSPHRVIDVYVIERTEQREAEEPPVIESTLEPSPQQEMSQKPHTPQTPFVQQRSRARWRTLLLVTLALLLTLGAGVSFVLLPLVTPSALITLVTTSEQISTTSTLHVVFAGSADPAKQQLAGRRFSSFTMSQQTTIPTTGITSQQARAAHGLITFYNAAPSVQVVPAGTLLTTANGTAIITEQDAVIPDAVMPTEGQVTVSAHAAIAGPTGNLRMGEIYGACCRLNVFVANGAFRGGQDARTYQSVTKQDVEGAVSSLSTSLKQGIQAALQTQVQSSETLLTPLSCTQKVTSNHTVGEEATQVMVTVEQTCTGTVYITQAFTTLTTQIATQDAGKRLGTGYTTTGVQASIIRVHPTTQGNIDIEVKCLSLWAPPFGPEQQQAIKEMIAGMSMSKAIATLLHLAGVQSVSLTLKHTTTVPTQSVQIQMLVLQMSREVMSVQ